MPINVCHIISGDLWGGAESMVCQLIGRSKALQDVKVSAILLNHGPLADRLVQKGIRAHVFDEARHSFAEIALHTAAVVRKLSPDILHSHRYKENILAYLVSFSLPKKTALVNTQHGMPEVNGNDPGMPKQLIAKINNRLQAHKFVKTVAVSRDMKNALVQRYRLPEDKVHVIHNGIAIPPVAAKRQPREKIVVGSAGRMFPVKDYPLMVEICQRVSQKSDRTQFELAGDGPMQANLQQRIFSFKLQEIFKLRGFVSDIGLFYRHLDIYLNTSIHEGIPISVLEAMANGIPAVAPAVGGLTEIITDGKDGFLVEQRDPDIFAERCLRLINDDNLRQSMGVAARQKVIRDYSVRRMALSYAQLYTKVQKRKS